MNETTTNFLIPNYTVLNDIYLGNLFHSMLLISVLGSYYQFTKLVILDYSLKGSGTLFYLLKVLYGTW